jgi:hypothetical protein
VRFRLSVRFARAESLQAVRLPCKPGPKRDRKRPRECPLSGGRTRERSDSRRSQQQIAAIFKRF